MDTRLHDNIGRLIDSYHTELTDISAREDAGEKNLSTSSDFINGVIEGLTLARIMVEFPERKHKIASLEEKRD